MECLVTKISNPGDFYAQTGNSKFKNMCNFVLVSAVDSYIG